MNEHDVWIGIIIMASIVTLGGAMFWGAIIADKHRPTA
jgi:hypothetical protein